MPSSVRSHALATLVIMLAFPLVGCHYRRMHHRRAASTIVRHAMPLDAGLAHDTAHPPIDCPLHMHGADANHMRPFEDVEKYIDHLERPERAVWQKPDDVVAALGLTGGETLIDLGSGSGYFTFRFARILPKGKVIAEDTEPEMVRHVHHKTMTEGFSNIRSVLIKPEAPEVSRDAD